MAAAISLLAIILLIMNYLLSTWLFGEKRKKISDTDGENIHRWVLVLIGIIVLIFSTVINRIDSNYVIWFLLGLLVVLCAFQSFMEWKYLKESKQHVIPLILMVFGVICAIGIIVINEQMKYTTFQEVVSDQLNEETTVRSISIYVNDFSNNVLEREAKTTINDEKIIDRILEDLSNLELKKDNDFRNYGDYTIRFVTTNQVEEDHYSTESWYIDLTENYAIITEGSPGSYEIVSETGHLKTIKSLIGSEEVDWEFEEE